MPPVADLTVERTCPPDDPLGSRLLVVEGRHCKPRPSAEIVTSAQAAAQYDVAVESWGQRGWNAVGRICRWAKSNGLNMECPD